MPLKSSGGDIGYQVRVQPACVIAEILHGRESELGTYPAFALDRMEPMRPVADRTILQIVATKTFAGGDFSIQPDGVCRLNPELARRVAQLAATYLSESDLSLGPTTTV